MPVVMFYFFCKRIFCTQELYAKHFMLGKNQEPCHAKALFASAKNRSRSCYFCCFDDGRVRLAKDALRLVQADIDHPTGAKQPPSDDKVICPSGKFSKPLSSPSPENISLRRSVEAALVIPIVPPLKRGRFAIVTDAGRDAVDVDGANDERARRTDGEVVWSRHLDAGVKYVTMLAHRDVRRRQERPIAGEQLC